MSSGIVQSGEAMFATVDQFAALRTEVAELRRQIVALQSERGSSDALEAMVRLQAGYAALPSEAKALHTEAEAEVRISIERTRVDG